MRWDIEYQHSQRGPASKCVLYFLLFAYGPNRFRSLDWGAYMAHLFPCKQYTYTKLSIWLVVFVKSRSMFASHKQWLIVYLHEEWCRFLKHASFQWLKHVHNLLRRALCCSFDQSKLVLLWFRCIMRSGPLWPQRNRYTFPCQTFPLPDAFACLLLDDFLNSLKVSRRNVLIKLSVGCTANSVFARSLPLFVSSQIRCDIEIEIVEPARYNELTFVLISTMCYFVLNFFRHEIAAKC